MPYFFSKRAATNDPYIIAQEAFGGGIITLAPGASLRINNHLSDGRWHHLAYIISDTIKSPLANSRRWSGIYLDGQLVDTRLHSGATSVYGSADVPGDLLIAKQPNLERLPLLRRDRRHPPLQPRALRWRVDLESETIPRAPGRMYYTMEVVDRAGNTRTTPPEVIDVEQVTVRRKRLERYGLILFDFDKAELRPEHRPNGRFYSRTVVVEVRKDLKDAG